MKFILSLSFVLLQINLSFADQKQEPYTIHHFTDQDGLPQNSVKYIMPDRDGFIWMATENGLVRFDGNRFLNFSTSNTAIQSSRINYIYPNAKKNGILARTIRNETMGVHNGRASLLVNTPGDFDYLWFRDTLDIYPVNGLPNVFLNQAGTSNYLIPVESDAYFNINRDTIRFMKGGMEGYRMRYPHPDPSRSFTLKGQFCYYEKNGQFILIKREGAYVLNLTGDLLQHPGWHSINKRPEIYWNFGAGQLFLYLDECCYRLELSDSSTIRSTLVMKGFDFKKNRILAVYHDEMHDRVFLGSVTRGLYICSQQQFRCLKAGREEDEVYYAQAPFGEHSIVTPLGTVLDPITGKKIKVPLLSKLEFPDRYSIMRDFNGNYWYKHHSILFKFNSDFTTVLWKQKVDDVINQLYIDKNGRLWVGMVKTGLYFLETAAASPQLQLYTAAVKDITYVVRGDQHVLWAATLKGLSRIDLSTRRIDTVPGLNNLYIRSLYAPSDKEVWITTYDHGVFLYKDGRLVNLPKDQKKYMETAHCIVKDDQGYLWITTNNGLFQTNYQDALDFAAGRMKDLFYLYYGKEQGFNTNEFNGGCQPCALQLQNGDISLPSLDGLVYFTPAKISTELPEKEIFIDQVELDAKIIDTKEAISLPNNFRNVRLSISTPYFGDPQNLHLHYSLEEEGKDDKELWLEMSNNRIIEFSSMHSGKYILRIRKLNGFGKNNITEKVFTILVGKAFYETIWFRILIGIAILLAGFALSWLRVRRVESKNQMLALRVTERTSELKETLDNLQLSEQQLRRQGFIQQRLIAAISHDLKTPLKYMMQVIGKGNEQRNGIGKDERNIIYESLYSMFHLVENLIQYLKSQFMDDVSSLEMVDLGQLLEKKANIFRVVSRAKEITIINNTAPHTVVLVNRQLLAIVIHNLLDNAVKYTRKGVIQLETYCNEEEILIRFIDTGIGMSPAVINWIDQYRTGVPIMEAKPASHDGIGLIMVMELLQLINGNIMVSPNNGHGTVVDITLTVIR